MTSDYCPYPATEALRDAARRAGIAFERGYVHGERREDEDTVTCLCVGDAWETSLTFEEAANGELWCVDSMTPAQAIGAFVAGRGRE